MKKLPLSILLMLMATVGLTQTPPSGPGFYFSSDSGVDLSYILDTFHGAGSSGPTLPGNSYPIAETNTPDIAALARGLQNDPKQIFDYVHDHIRYVHYFGSKKGAELTLLERSGNDLDQCALLVALLQAAGLTNVNYQFGTMSVPYQVTDGSDADYMHWVGTTLSNTDWSATTNFVHLVNGQRGFPYTAVISGDSNHFVMHHCVVNLALGGTNYTLDPSFKISEPIAGINLSSAMALDTNALMTTASGTSTADYVQNLNESALDSVLTGLTTNLLGYIQSNCPNATVEQVLGGRQIVSSAGYSLGAAPSPFSAYTLSGTLPISTWQYIPTNLMVTFTIGLQTTNQIFFVPGLCGDRLSLTFSSNGMAQLWREDTAVFSYQTTGTDPGVYVSWAINQPFGTWDTVNNTLIDGTYYDFDDTNAYYLRTNSSYALFYAFDMNIHYLQKRQDELNSYWAQGLSSTSRQIQTETLNVMGLSYFLQNELASEMIDIQTGVLLGWHQNYGRMAQETNGGYYIDIRAAASGQVAGTGNGDTDLTNQWQAIDATVFFGSTLEGVIIEQQTSTNTVGVSTTRMLEISSTNTSRRVFLATSNNWTVGTNVRTNLTNYAAGQLSAFDSYISAGFKILLPQNGSLPVDSFGTWTGSGYAAVWNLNNSVHAADMEIAPNYLGGSSDNYQAQVDPAYVQQLALQTEIRFDIAAAEQAAAFINFLMGGDPVNMIDGSFTLNVTDLSLGQQEPRGLSFSRMYTPANRYQNPAGMANGWLHNYYFSATLLSDPKISLGATTPAQAAAMLAATHAFLQLHTQQADPKNWTVASLISLWGAERLLKACASVTLGSYTLEFVKQPDGSFTPPASCTMTLSQTNAAFELQERHGRTFLFGTNGLLTNLVDQYTNVSLSLTYNSSNWVSTAKDWKNRQLTFNYTGSPSRLTSVTDGTRTVSYGYSTNYNIQGDLTTVVDVENKTNTFIYDNNHQIVATIDALGRLVTSNMYDSFGRVITQYVQGDTNKTWQFFWSGYLNTEQDPAGGQQQYLYDEKFRCVASRDALGNLSQTVFDGQDHAVATVSPLNETNQFLYDGQHNIINLIDRLGFSTTNVYDSQNNLIAVFDANGHSNSFGYNSHFQVTVSTNGAGDCMTNTYDSSDGNLSTMSDSSGTTTYSYDPTYRQLNAVIFPANLGTNGYLKNSYGDVVTFTNGRGFTTSYLYNLRRQLTNSSGPTNLTTLTLYDAAGNAATNIDALSNKTVNSWSATRHLLSTTFPTVQAGTPVATNTYDVRDWLAISKDPLQNPTYYSNDLAGRSTAVIDALNRTNSFGYDNDGRRTFLTNGAGQYISQQWDKRGEMIQIVDPATNITSHGFDPVGNQIYLTNRNGKRWQFAFDDANRLVTTYTPLLRSNVQVWNHEGLLASNIQPSRATSAFLYDARNRLTNRTDGVGTTSFFFDFNGNNTSIAEAGKSNSWTFDAYDRAITYIDSFGNVIQYRYDANHNLTNLIYPGNRTVKYFYDSLNRLTNITDWANRETTLLYDLAGRLTSITRPNGTTRIINYDAVGEVTNIVEQAASRAPIAFIGRSFDKAGRAQWEFVAPLPQSNNPPSRTMTIDDDNRLATFNGTNITNDLDGNMTYAPLTNSTFVNYTYDGRNRLVNVGGLDYTYDPAGYRVVVTNGATVTQFVVNPNAKLPQVLMRVKTNLTNYYIYGAGLLYEITETAATTNIATYHFDARGSTVALTDINGNITDHVEYSAYGLTAYRLGTNDTPFLYNGRYGVQTDTNGLLYMQARYYNPYLCRFVNADPTGFSGGLNWYAYADGNPINEVDPFGLSPGEGNPLLGPGGLPAGPPNGIFAPPGSYYPGGMYYSPSPIPLNAMDYFGGGLFVGAVTSLGVVAAAPVLVAGLVTAGMSTTGASATVTLAAATYAAYGTAKVTTDIVDSSESGNWNQVTWDAGLLTGGLIVGMSGGGRALGENISGNASAVDQSWNPFADSNQGFQPNYPNGSLISWLAKAPTPQSGGLVLTLGAGGANPLIVRPGRTLQFPTAQSSTGK